MESEYLNSNKQNIFKTASGIMLLAVLLFIYSCSSNKPEEIKAIEEIQNIPSLELYDYESFITDSGEVKYHLITPKLLNYDKREDPYKEFPLGGHIITYDSINVIRSEIKCKYAINYEKEKLWDLRNNVEAINKDGVIFNTEQLFWNETEKRIYTEKFIKITTEDNIITGYGLEATQDLDEYEIQNVTAILEVETDEK
ncbi:LPS export ABC transporter periplasmic protein LptC [Plebeiibacterium sediminum]|uniref:LPS export ABC transporter periplasmic protein LptC n=1 Tax=Plebeiibacterium sediminum TaxID=2992112 RepID=A0AAE3M760_9BACT|nr:LPS export ABC transporter periplasmic protein LptC [Plebeiobacterium sediminum]MCW3788389.1 LPS export ABC transporter periplasmic protein LptC [Plebeiobacterium sediminum]